MIKEAEILEIANKLNRIIDDDTPFLMRKNNEIFVIGNATNTSVKKHDYTLEFEDESSEITQKKFCNKSVTPRRNFTIIEQIKSSMSTIQHKTSSVCFKEFKLIKARISSY